MDSTGSSGEKAIGNQRIIAALAHSNSPALPEPANAIQLRRMMGQEINAFGAINNTLVMDKRTDRDQAPS
jgi:hypothetical protein